MVIIIFLLIIFIGIAGILYISIRFKVLSAKIDNIDEYIKVKIYADRNLKYRGYFTPQSDDTEEWRKHGKDKG